MTIALCVVSGGCQKSETGGDFLTSAADSVPDPVPPAASSEEAKQTVKATFLGVYGYGNPGIVKSNAASFKYRFKVGDAEKTYTISTEPDYSIQNTLKVGYQYNIVVKDGAVTKAEVIDSKEYTDAKPVVSGEAGVRTITNFLKTAMMPVGTALYVYGGGWNWQDDSGSYSSRTIGFSTDWVRFFKEHNEDYTFKDDSRPYDSYYPYGGFNQYHYAGLDCSGFVGWVLYNTLEKEDMKESYVTKATTMAKSLADKGLGTYSKTIATDKNGNKITYPGDIISTTEHVWISLGTCSDGSTLMVNSDFTSSRNSKPGAGVQIAAIGSSRNCEAYTLAKKYMARYYPDWYARYNVYLNNPVLFFDTDNTTAGLFSWHISSAGLTDPDGMRSMKPSQVLKVLFKE